MDHTRLPHNVLLKIVYVSAATLVLIFAPFWLLLGSRDETQVYRQEMRTNVAEMRVALEDIERSLVTCEVPGP